MKNEILEGIKNENGTMYITKIPITTIKSGFKPTAKIFFCYDLTFFYEIFSKRTFLYASI